MTDNEIYHFGVLGMRWGVRRYQNYDGTLTAAGRRHYEKQIRKAVDENVRGMRKEAANEARVALNSDSAVKSAKEQYAKESVDDNRSYRNLTNEELRYAVEHYKLEQQYSDLINGDRQRDVKRGREETREMLQTAGAVLAVGATAVGIAKSIVEIKAKKGK